MKNIFLFLAFAGLSAAFSCKEKPILIPDLSDGGGGGGGADVPRRALVEELTGVRCPNCPDGTAALVGLGATLGDELIVVSIHAAPGYDKPYTGESKYDFRTADGTAMANYLGNASFFPTATVNRRLLPNGTSLYLPRASWASAISSDLDKDATVDLRINPVFNAANRSLSITVDVKPLENLSGDHLLTVLITQDSIVDYQKVDLDKIPDYTHRHVLRDVVSSPTGDVIAEPMTAGSTITKTFNLTLPADWDEKHCSIVAFVHRGGDPDKEVIQAAEAHVVK